jgi:hypothetical protein
VEVEESERPLFLLASTWKCVLDDAHKNLGCWYISIRFLIDCLLFFFCLFLSVVRPTSTRYNLPYLTHKVAYKGMVLEYHNNMHFFKEQFESGKGGGM